MDSTATYRTPFIILLLLVFLFFVGNLCLGSIFIPLKDVLLSLTGQEPAKESWKFIITEYRLPKALTALIVGGGLAVSGLLMQTLFRNPLAGPFVLGISSGASLGVALVILGASSFGFLLSSSTMNSWTLVIAAALGSFLVLIVVLLVTLKIKDTMAILIIGLMFGSLTAAIVSVLSYFSKAEELQRYIFWSFGSLGNQSWTGVGILALCFFIGIGLSVFTIKTLNSLLLGENYAKSVGIHIKKNTLIIMLATSILAGSVTAFAGPIAFIGLAVPHLTRLIFKTSNHSILVPAVLLSGSLLMLVCDSIAQVPFTNYTLPINAITSLVGAPVVIWLLIRKRSLLF